MTTQAAQTAQTAYADHFEIDALVHRFFRALDERKFEEGWARAYFTEDVRAETPIGTVRGEEAVRHSEEAVGRFERTQHLASGVLAEAEPGARTATASWNALMAHVHREETLAARGPGAEPVFTVGGLCEAELRRTEAGWRISRLAIRALWTTGRPPVLPEGVAPEV
ncbi:nuclear transport factor 2 family protein [Streptomyces sp. ODS28]|uniref:nuclear transport factor 2 family protein n=1 Tax=Streptomyces sp. ODS28 TaxID=3136688 RepID=UPI0031EC33AC